MKTGAEGLLFKVKSERGLVTVFVLSTLLVLMLIAITVYVNMANKSASQLKQIGKIQKEYQVDDNKMDEEYHNNTPKQGLEIGDIVTYTPNGTYNWQGKYSGDSKDTTLNSTNADFKISKWRVLNIENGKVTLVPTEPTTGTVYLGNAQGYNNGVKLLNDACNSLYGNTAKGITARSMNIEDIEKYMTAEALKSAHEFIWDGTKYREQVQNAYTSGKNYPLMYAKENLSYINNGPKKEDGLGMSEQTEFIEPTENGATDGKITIARSIQLYQTSWLGYNDFMQTGFKIAINGTKYYDLIIPQGSSTTYWLASRCLHNTLYCNFSMRTVSSGSVSSHYMYDSIDRTGSDSCALFPIVSLSSELISGNKTEGYIVKVEPNIPVYTFYIGTTKYEFEQGMTWSS